jgi:hypothetical protein
MYMYNSNGIYIFYCLLFIYIYIKIMYLMNKYKEGFTPKIREMYRPYIRDSRMFYENTKNNYLYRINHFFRNIGLNLL